MKKKYIAPALEAFPVEVQQMMAISYFDNQTANGDDALVKGDDWDIFGDGGDDFASDSPYED